MIRLFNYILLFQNHWSIDLNIPRSRFYFRFKTKTTFLPSSVNYPVIEKKRQSCVIPTTDHPLVDTIWSSPEIPIQHMYSNLGYSYKPPEGYQYDTPRTKALLAGCEKFRPTEIEGYHIKTMVKLESTFSCRHILAKKAGYSVDWPGSEANYEQRYLLSMTTGRVDNNLSICPHLWDIFMFTNFNNRMCVNYWNQSLHFCPILGP